MDREPKKIKSVRRVKNHKITVDLPKFKSIYAKILYMELQKKKAEKSFYMTLEELKTLFQVPEYSYIYSHLRIRVLDIIQKEFEEVNSPIKFSYEVMKEDCKIKIKFNIE